MRKCRHLHLVRSDRDQVTPVTPPAPMPAQVQAQVEERRKPPLRPRRPSAAVRKALRLALANSEQMLETVRLADPRFPSRAKAAVATLAAHGERITTLSAELSVALACEERHRLWKQGRPYVE